nr:LUD domain-containing protein [Sphingomonas xinjiangensis]
MGGNAGDVADEARALLRAPERPPVDPAALAETFAERLAAPSVAASLERVPVAQQLPAAVARHLAQHVPMPGLYLPPDAWLQALDWRGIALDAAVTVDGGAALAVATAAVAETGSLVLDTSPTAPMLPNFLALHHLVVVRHETLVAHLEDIPAPLEQPRARYWITGVSGTTDIEGQYVRGAHGPRFLHVLLLG